MKSFPSTMSQRSIISIHLDSGLNICVHIFLYFKWSDGEKRQLYSQRYVFHISLSIINIFIHTLSDSFLEKDLKCNLLTLTTLHQTLIIPYTGNGATGMGFNTLVMGSFWCCNCHGYPRYVNTLPTCPCLLFVPVPKWPQHLATRVAPVSPCKSTHSFTDTRTPPLPQPHWQPATGKSRRPLPRRRWLGVDAGGPWPETSPTPSRLICIASHNIVNKLI